MRGAHRSFRQLADEIGQLPLDGSQLGALNRAVGYEQALYDLLTGMPRARIEPAEITERVDQLIDAAREVLAINNLIVDREVEHLRASADEVQRGLILLLLFSTAVALTIALALTRYISRPIAAIDNAIRQLGAADFSRPIVVRGPEDLRYLGRRLDWLRRRLEEFETQKKPLPAPRVARAEDAAHRAARRRRAAERPGGGTPRPAQKQVVSIVRDNSVKLQRLIEELLDYQRALHAAASLEVMPVVLDSLVAEAARAHELAARSKNLRLEVDAEAAMLEADPEKLRSIIDNLVSNAVKFTPPGGRITVRGACNRVKR
jgi:two-component system sensor histidine kinase GlrK